MPAGHSDMYTAGYTDDTVDSDNTGDTNDTTNTKTNQNGWYYSFLLSKNPAQQQGFVVYSLRVMQEHVDYIFTGYILCVRCTG